jgi:D-alanine-D-alanine ligase
MKVAVLLGGDSPERDVSLASGAGVLGALRTRGHEARPVDPALPPGVSAEPLAAKIGERPSERMAPLSSEEKFAWLNVEPIRSADVVFIALHGGSGEDGTIQALLEAAGIAYTGSGILGSALAMNKDRSKALFREALVQTAPHILLGASGADLPGGSSVRERIEGSLGFPVVIKPNCQGSSVGFSFVRDASGLDEALRLAASFGDDLLVERYVPGREITAAILGGEALPLVEIIPEGGFYDYKRKYTKGTSRYVAPAELEENEGEPYCLEVNTLPGMTELSLVPMAARATGIAFDDLVERICAMAAARRSKTRS